MHYAIAMCDMWPDIAFEVLPYWANPLNSWAMNIVFSAVVMTPASKHTYLLIMNAILHVYMYVVSGNVLVPCRQSSGIMKTGCIHSCTYMDLPSNLTPGPSFSFWHLFLVGSIFLRRQIRATRNSIDLALLPAITSLSQHDSILTTSDHIGWQWTDHLASQGPFT